MRKHDILSEQEKQIVKNIAEEVYREEVDIKLGYSSVPNHHQAVGARVKAALACFIYSNTYK
jgi:hypothetical protein